MAFLKSVPRGGKKQAPMPGPHSAAYKKIVAAKKSAAATKSAHGAPARKGGKKNSRSGSTFSSLKSKQMLVERVKRQIWASVLKINDAIISLALAGNFNAAKALFDFAGVYSLPDGDNENAAAALVPSSAPAAAAEPACAEAVTDPVDAFFRSIGAQPEPEMAS
jgi:hypothetical protein